MSWLLTAAGLVGERAAAPIHWFYGVLVVLGLVTAGRRWPRSYSCAVDCRPDALLDRWLHTTHLYGHDADAIARAWQAGGITHVLLYRAGYRAIVEAGFDPVTPRDVATLQDLEARHLSPAGEWGDAYTLFELVP